MNYDQIVRELKNLNLDVNETRSGGSKYIELNFKRGNSQIYAHMSLKFELNYSKDHRFNSAIREEYEGQQYSPIINPNNQTEFFQLIKELKTTNKPFKQIKNMKAIKETEKTVKKLETQFKEIDQRLNERKTWLAYIKGEITREQRSKIMKENRIRIYGDQ